MSRQIQNSPEKLTKSSDPVQDAHAARVDRIMQAMNTTIQKSEGPTVGWDELRGPSKEAVNPDFRDNSTLKTQALLNDTTPNPGLVNEGHQLVSQSIIGEMQRRTYSRIAAALVNRGIDPSRSAYIMSANTVDLVDYPDLTPDQFATLQQISQIAVDFIDSAITKKPELPVTPATLEKNGLTYEKNPPHLELAA